MHASSPLEAYVRQHDDPGLLPIPPAGRQCRIQVRIAVVDEQAPVRFERPRHLAERRDVLALAEVPETREEADAGVELPSVREPSHVAAHEAEPLALAMPTSRLAEHRRRQVYADDRVAPPSKLARVPPEPAGHVENTGAPLQAESRREEVVLRVSPSSLTSGVTSPLLLPHEVAGELAPGKTSLTGSPVCPIPVSLAWASSRGGA